MHGTFAVRIPRAGMHNHNEGHLRLANFYFNRNIIVCHAMENGINLTVAGSPEREKGGFENMSETSSKKGKTSMQLMHEAEYLNREANELMYAGKGEKALELYNKAIEINPIYAASWHNKANCLDELGRHHEAVECYSKAIEIDPYHAETWYNKGISLKKMGRVKEADHCIDCAVKLALGIEEPVR
jgi:tetratricopeptide (TPR) repeat protein